jgi:hypothetical protein
VLYSQSMMNEFNPTSMTPEVASPQVAPRKGRASEEVREIASSIFSQSSLGSEAQQLFLADLASLPDEEKAAVRIARREYASEQLIQAGLEGNDKLVSSLVRSLETRFKNDEAQRNFEQEELIRPVKERLAFEQAQLAEAREYMSAEQAELEQKREVDRVYLEFIDSIHTVDRSKNGLDFELQPTQARKVTAEELTQKKHAVVDVLSMNAPTDQDYATCARVYSEFVDRWTEEDFRKSSQSEALIKNHIQEVLRTLNLEERTIMIITPRLFAKLREIFPPKKSPLKILENSAKKLSRVAMTLFVG